MRLSLSVRVGEQYYDKRQTAISLNDLADMAAEEGYHALCMRASQLGLETPAETVRQKRAEMSDRGLAISMVTGDFPIPENSFEAPAALRNITPYLDLADLLHCDMIRVALKKEEDIEWTQRAADEARERGIRLAQQCHVASLFEQVDEALDVLRRVGRPNFGVTYEPANLEACGQDYGPETIKRLSPHMINVYLQNQRLDPAGKDTLSTWSRGEVGVEHVPISAQGGIDFPVIMDTLESIGYDGYVTVHQASTGGETPEETIRNSARYLKSLISFDG
jgi:sugar phosphate isomerase/epimerase